ncbi:hypothetical protein TWF718_007484 [Orbilia javanica]|uniref:Uncharacterized protein n=1 Tax=Orbilia javanica TaxID=47235 RepID=A0AAN8MPF0_9PEZI
MLVLRVLLFYNLTVTTLAIGMLNLTSISKLLQSVKYEDGELLPPRETPRTHPRSVTINSNFRRAVTENDSKELFGANPNKLNPPVPGKIKVNSDGFTFFARIDLGLKDPVLLVLDTFSSYSAVIGDREANTKGVVSELAIPNGKTDFGNDIKYTYYSDGSWAAGYNTWYGKISSPGADKLNPPASFYGYFSLLSKTSEFRRKDKNGVLGLARESKDYYFESKYPKSGNSSLKEPFIPWGIQIPPVDGNYSYFTTYLNWREPENQYLGLDYFKEEELGKHISTLKVIAGRKDISDWRVSVKASQINPIAWRKSDGLVYAEKIKSVDYGTDIESVILLDTKSEYTFIREEQAISIAEAMGGSCSKISDMGYVVNHMGSDYPGSNFKFNGKVCMVPCQRRGGETKYFQTHRVAIDLPFGEGYIRIPSDSSLVAYFPQEFVAGDPCKATKPEEICNAVCVSAIQPLRENGPNYPDVLKFSNNPSQRDLLYGHTVWANVFAKWDINQGTIGVWNYKGAVRDPEFDVNKLPGRSGRP